MPNKDKKKIINNSAKTPLLKINYLKSKETDYPYKIDF